LIRGGEYLEQIQNVDTVVFDKTGTITKGEPKVTDIIKLDTLSLDEILEFAAITEKKSEHPLAEAVLTAAREKGIGIEDPDEFEAIPGHGIKIRKNNNEILLGNRKLLKSINLNFDKYENDLEKLENDGKTAVLLVVNKNISGIIAIADVIKDNAKETISELKNMGIETILLTGDNNKTANAVGRIIGIDEVIAEVLPDEKANIIKKLQEQGKVVAMVGDGINDAPSLAQANIGIAIGSGADVAKETGGLILVRSDIRDVVNGIKISKKTMKVIKENFFWAFIYNVAMIPLAMMGIVHPIIAAAAMSLSSLTVVSNSARLKLFKIKGERIISDEAPLETFKKPILKCKKCGLEMDIPMHCDKPMHPEIVDEKEMLVCWMGPECGKQLIPEHHGIPMEYQN
jgi:Cu+-exporting ATPase